MYRLSSFQNDCSISATNNNNRSNNEPPLITPTYETIDVQNLVDHTHSGTSHYGYPQLDQSASGLGVYTESSQGTSDGLDGSNGCMSDNPTVTIPDNHRLYPVDNSNQLYYGRTASIMPMTGIFSPNIIEHHYHPYSKKRSGYLTRSLHYYKNKDWECDYATDSISNIKRSYPFYGGCSSSSPIIKEEDFDIFNAIFALISLMLHVCCSGATLILAYFLWRHEHDKILFWLTLTATIVPSIIVNIISLKWLLTDNRSQQEAKNENQENGDEIGHAFLIQRPKIGPCGWMFRILLHVFLFGPILRYVDLLGYAIKSWSDKKSVEQPHKDNISWSSATALPSLSTTLPRPRYPNSAIQSELPNFQTSSKPKKKKSNKLQRIDYYLLTVAEDRNTSLLSLFQCLMQCTIQMIIHSHSILAHWYFEHHHQLSNYNHNYTEYVQFTVIGLSLFKTSWSISSYHRALRRASYDKRNLSAIGTIVQSIWHCFTLSSRILAIVLFLYQFGFWLLPIGIGHWGVMTIWIMHQGTHFFDSEHGMPNPCSEYLFNMLVGMIYLFVFINLKDEPTRYKYLAFYIITFVENFTFSALWFWRVQDHWWYMRLPLFLSVSILFGLSIIAMQLYYSFVHPNGRPLLINKTARCC